MFFMYRGCLEPTPHKIRIRCDIREKTKRLLLPCLSALHGARKHHTTMQRVDTIINYKTMNKMKKINCLMLLMLAIMLLPSCAHHVYPTKTMYTNYNLRMTSQNDREIKSKVRVYMSEAEIQGEFKVLSVNLYSPFSFVFFHDHILKKKFLEKATKKAYEEGGNAVLISAPGYFKVLNIIGWDSDDAAIEDYNNPIFDTESMDIVGSGQLATMKRSDRKRHENEFMDEISAQISYAKELKEVEMLRTKVKVLNDYNLTLKRPNKSIEKAVKKDTKKLNRMEKKIKKQASKAQAPAKTK